MTSDPNGPDGAGTQPDLEGHGWWPYLAPYAAFIVITTFAPRLPDVVQPWLLAIKPAFVLGLVLWFRAQGAYPEWRGAGARIGLTGGLLDILVGLALTAVWVMPFVWFPELRPEPGDEFDAAMAGEEFIALILGLRLFGYALVTPIFEELFIRSFVMRVADAWEVEDFRNLPIATYTPISMLVTVVVFTMGHVPWEYWVCVPWVFLSNLWFYYRKSLSAVMLLHATTNAALWALAIWGEGLLRNPDGTPFSFLFFM